MILIVSIAFWVSCREAYLPPAITNPNNFLVVDGVINSGNDSTIIQISRSRNLNDTFAITYEEQASVRITSPTGFSYTLQDIGLGKYVAPPLPLNPSSSYRLEITTMNGSQYASDYVPVKKTPVIDSLTWFQDDAVHCTINAHDDLRNTGYYRWEFVETWEYHSVFYSELGYDESSNSLFNRDSTNMLDKCWSTVPSSEIVISTTSNLAADVVSHYPIITINNGSEKLSVRYSILVKQYALTKDAFIYWQMLKKNAKELGSIFGTQPVKIEGNIRCINNPEEPVIGFISVSSVEQKRMFINKNELTGWHVDLPPALTLCEARIVDLSDAIKVLQRSPGLGPYYIIPVPPPFTTTATMALANKTCLECTFWGGTTQKPAFW